MNEIKNITNQYRSAGEDLVFDLKKNNHAITLIALIITIIIMIILAGVVIYYTVGDNGLINTVLNAKEETLKVQALEELRLKVLYIQTSRKGNATLQDVIEGLNGYVEFVDISNASEILVTYKGYQFKIDSSLLVELYNDNLKEDKTFIIYNANGGENTPENQSKLNTVISNNKPTKENYIFVGWGTKENATDVVYKPGDKYNGNTAITLYAIWSEKIEYLENDGTQYIDTNFYPNQDTSIELIAETTENVTSAWLGARNAGGTTNAKAFVLWNTSGKFQTYYNNSQNFINNFNIAINTKYNIYKNKNITEINGNQIVDAYDNFTSPSTLTLFGVKTYVATGFNVANSVDNRMAKLKLYSCKIWDNNVLIRDYIPVKDCRGIICLFDKVNKKLYYNQGTGNFK